jgi:protein-tyrosine phosphatase
MGPKLYWIDVSPGGRLAISARPRGGDWLEDEIEGWRKEGVNVVVSLLTKAENEELDLATEASLTMRKGIEFHSFPIEDRGVPKSSASVEKLVEQLSGEIHDGKSVVIHCRQGVGRSSLILAAVMVAAGEDLRQALSQISQARGVEVPETIEQRNWLSQFSKAHASTGLARHTR